jgi:hypothetical protein
MIKKQLRFRYDIGGNTKCDEVFEPRFFFSHKNICPGPLIKEPFSIQKFEFERKSKFWIPVSMRCQWRRMHEACGVIDFEKQKSWAKRLCYALQLIPDAHCIKLTPHAQIDGRSERSWQSLKQGCGSVSGSGLDPDSVTFWIWIRIGNPDSGSRSKTINKFRWKNALISYGYFLKNFTTKKV